MDSGNVELLEHQRERIQRILQKNMGRSNNLQLVDNSGSFCLSNNNCQVVSTNASQVNTLHTLLTPNTSKPGIHGMEPEQ